eukprot:scaffold22884_cov66-Phaeocystis_antarctica.AAC.7
MPPLATPTLPLAAFHHANIVWLSLTCGKSEGRRGEGRRGQGRLVEALADHGQADLRSCRTSTSRPWRGPWRPTYM